MKISVLGLLSLMRYHFLDDQLRLSLGSNVVDPLTTDL